MHSSEQCSHSLVTHLSPLNKSFLFKVIFSGACQKEELSVCLSFSPHLNSSGGVNDCLSHLNGSSSIKFTTLLIGTPTVGRSTEIS